MADTPPIALWQRLCARFPRLRKIERRLKALRDMRRLRRTGAFDAAWYAANNSDIAATGLAPLAHYVRKGAWEGRRPRPDFDPLCYLAIHPDVAARGVEPFTHYLLSGTAEGRATAPDDGALAALAARRRAAPAPAGWYGGTPLTAGQIFPSARTAAGPFNRTDLPPTALTDPAARDWCLRLGPVDLLQAHIATRVPEPDVAPSPVVPHFTLLTVFDGDRAGFARTAGWVGAVLAQPRAVSGRVDWLVLNDDPACETDALEALLPGDVRGAIHLVSDGHRRGEAARRNQGTDAAHGDFLLFIDSGETLAPDALDILTHYIAAFPLCRCICGGGLELGSGGRPVARQDRPRDAAELVTQASACGALVAVRRDLILASDGFDLRFDGASAYALLLEAATREPVLAVPELLIGRPATHKPNKGKIRAARVAAMRALTDQAWPQPARPAITRSLVEQGLCLVRTQGRRPDLLAQALHSIYEQSEPLVAAVIVHGDAETFERVRAQAPHQEGAVVFLHASDTSRRRGYPWNVGLDYLDQNSDRFQYLSFLDDDDIYYPLFAARMVEAFCLTGADVVYGLVNSRTPGGKADTLHMPLPTACLVAGNFIPTNAYAVRTDALAGSGIRVLEDVDYFEDWDFLLSLLGAGLRFHLVPEALGEFLMIGDGNTLTKRDPAHHDLCQARAMDHGARVAAALGMARYYRDLMDFDFANDAVRHPAPSGHLIAAKQQFLRAAARAEAVPS